MQQELMFADETARIDTLFKQAEAFLDNNPYTGYGEAQQFYTKLRGVSMEGRQELVKDLNLDTPIRLERDPANPYDCNAIKVVTNEGVHIGFLARDLALVLAPLIDEGEATYSAFISSVTGGTNGHNLGVNVLLLREGTFQSTIDVNIRQSICKLPDPALRLKIREAVLGEWDYHAKQKEAIDALFAGENVLAVFGTGRGKSAVFQSIAAYRALREGKVTIIVYPLRALSNDQYFSMQRMFTSLGIRVHRANGSLGTEERTELFEALHEGNVDIILTTPEFLLHHAAKFSPILDRLGLFVADESHHIAKDTHRPAYRRLDKVVELLNHPQVLAVTATADDDTSAQIVSMLGITRVVVDAHVRANLAVRDVRNCANKETYLLDVVAKGKSIVYVGTRKDSVRIAEFLRSNIPGYAYKVAFYHGGMTPKDRSFVEEAFRSGLVQCCISTSAFGEGINIPDVTDVVLFNLNFSYIDFNQQGGRAGRGGQQAIIHLLFGDKDIGLNMSILKGQAPSRDDVAGVYVALTKLSASVSNQEIAEMAKKCGADKRCNETMVSASLGILEELGLIRREVIMGKREIYVTPNPARVDINSSVRFKEAHEELKEFVDFNYDIMRLSVEELQELVQKPICPADPDALVKSLRAG